MNKCSNYYCDNKFDIGHNGAPTFEGRVCTPCNTLVINDRLMRLNDSI